MIKMSEIMLDEIAPPFRTYIQHLCSDLRLGLCKARVDVERISSIVDIPSSQFRLVLPYCSKRLRWEIIFDQSAPWFAPDFRFDDDSFFDSVDVFTIEKQLPSLDNWNQKDPKALTQVISELVHLYRNHQIGKLRADEGSRAYFEYSALLGHEGIQETDIEVWVGDHSAEFLIKLNIDTSQLPEIYNGGTALRTQRPRPSLLKMGLPKYIFGEFALHSPHWPDEIDENPCVDSALLLVRYPNSAHPELILSPSLTRLFGHINLPPMHRNGVLIDYVPSVTQLINNKIQLILSNEKFKRELLSQLIAKYNGAVLEHDDSNASFLFQINDFHWILQIEMGQDFPEKPPIMTLMSVYYQTKGKPTSKVLPPCPYQTLPKFEAYIKQQFDIFKAECTGSASLNNFEN